MTSLVTVAPVRSLIGIGYLIVEEITYQLLCYLYLVSDFPGTR